MRAGRANAESGAKDKQNKAAARTSDKYFILCSTAASLSLNTRHEQRKRLRLLDIAIHPEGNTHADSQRSDRKQRGEESSGLRQHVSDRKHERHGFTLSELVGRILRCYFLAIIGPIITNISRSATIAAIYGMKDSIVIVGIIMT